MSKILKCWLVVCVLFVSFINVSATESEIDIESDNSSSGIVFYGSGASTSNTFDVPFVGIGNATYELSFSFTLDPYPDQLITGVNLGFNSCYGLDYKKVNNTYYVTCRVRYITESSGTTIPLTVFGKFLDFSYNNDFQYSLVDVVVPPDNSTAENIFDAVYDGFSYVNQYLSTIESVLTGILSLIIENQSELMKSLGSQLYPMVGSIVGQVTGIFDVFKDVLPSIHHTANVIGAINDKFNQIFAWSDDGNSLFNLIDIPNGFKNVSDGLNSIKTTIEEFSLKDVTDGLTDIKKVIQDIKFDNLFNVTNEAGTNLWDVLKSLTDNLGSVLGGLFDLGTTITNGLVELGTTIVDGVVHVVDLIYDLFIKLFIPSEDFFDNFFDEIHIDFENRTGILTFPLSVFATVLDSLQNVNTDGSFVLNIPEFSLFDTILWTSQSVDVKEMFSQGALKTFYDTYMIVVNGLIVLMFIGYVQKKFNRVLG